MRVQSVFLAQGYTARNGLYDIQGAGLDSLTIQTETPAFDVCMFIVCESTGGDIGQTIKVNVEALGPSGQRLLHIANDARVDGPKAMGAIQVRTPYSGTGPYVYRAWIDDADSVAVTASLAVDRTQ